jgi:transcriptional regulator with XRE-family HTH domain
MILDYIIIGKRIKEIRLQNSLTQEKLAEMCNKTASHISLIESGKRHVTLNLLIKIADNLDMTVDTFLNGLQKNDSKEYKSDLIQLIADCNNYEKRVIFELVMAIKKSLRNNINLTTCQEFDM